MIERNANVLMGASDTISALLADVDGTLVTKAKVLTKGAIEAVRRLHESGIAFFITSGRPPRGMRMLRLRMKTRVLPMQWSVSSCHGQPCGGINLKKTGKDEWV